ncbi:MAG: hypothetical protein ACHQYP_07315 [Nitrospiria bacterium]
MRPIPYDSPSSIFKKIYRAPPAFLLESGKEIGKIGRYSFMGTNPYLTVEFKDDQWTTKTNGKTQKSPAKDPFVYLRQLLKDYQIKIPSSLPPFFGGAVGYFGYEVVRHFEKLPELKKNSEDFPDIFLLFVDTIIAIDHLARTTDIIYTLAPEELAGCEWSALRQREEKKYRSIWKNSVKNRPIMADDLHTSQDEHLASSRL